MRPTLVGLALMIAASIAAPADAQGGRQWIGISNPDSAALIYGTPQSDDSAISFACARATKALAVSFIFEPVGARDGMRLDMELASEGGKVLLHAAGQRLQLDDSFMLQATTKLDAPLRRTLLEGRTLSIRVQDKVTTFPLAGAAAQAAALVAACG